jgi:subtilisin-like proprotein convertase family protein
VAAHPTNPDILYIGAASGGVWKTTNATSANPTWTPLTDNQAALTTGAIALAPSNPNIVYVGTGEPNGSGDSFYGRGVLKSTDGGTTWTLQGNAQFDRLAIGAVVVNPTDPNTVFVATSTAADGVSGTRGIYRTTDGGVTWVNLTASIGTSYQYTDIAMDPTNPNTMYFGVDSGDAAGGVYKSTNALAATPIFSQLSGGLTTGSGVHRPRIALAPSSPQTLYVAFNNSSNQLGGMFQSTNGGTSWTDRTAGTPNYVGSQGFYDNEIIASPTAPNTVFACGQAGSNSFLMSTDGGATWTGIATNTSTGVGPHVDHHDMGFDSTGRLIDTDDGGVFRLNSTSPITWVSLSGLSTTHAVSGALMTNQFVGIALHPTDPNTIFGGTQDNGTMRFTNSAGWSFSEGGDGGSVFFDPFNANNLYRVSPVGSFGASNFMRKSTDGGMTWFAITSGITDASLAQFYPPIAPDPSTPNRVFLGTDVMNVSTDGGASWGRLPGDTTTFAAGLRSMGIGPASTSTIYAATNTHVYITTNNGTSWLDSAPAGGTDFKSFAVDPTNSNIAYITSADFTGNHEHVWRTTNAGVSWTPITNNLPDIPAYSIVLDPGPTNSTSDDVLYVGNDQGVYRSTNLGATWSKFGTGLPNVQVRDLELNTSLKILAAGTYGRGVWEMLTGTPTTPGTIAGTVYNDLNANGTRDTNEPGLAGWTVFRDDNNNGVLDAPTTTTKTATNVPINITDFNTSTSTLNVSSLSGAVSDVNIKLNITHTYDGDIEFYLISPAGTKVPLAVHVGSGGHNFTDTVFDDQAPTIISAGTAPFTATLEPMGALSDFNGQSPNGVWTVSITDTGPGDTGTLNSWSLTISTGEPVTITDARGNYQFLNQPNGAYQIRRVLQAGWNSTDPPGLAQSVTIAGNGAFNRNFGLTTVPAPVPVIQINDGSAQRSMVTSLKLTFASHVTFTSGASAAFSLLNTTNANQPVTLAATTDDSGAGTAVTLTFTGGAVDLGGSLSDGRYTLKIIAGGFSGAGFDGNGNGTAQGSTADDYTLVGSPSTPVNLFRLFGDFNGDGFNGANDFAIFRQFFNSYIFAFDFDGDLAVGTTDFSEFRNRFNTSI